MESSVSLRSNIEAIRAYTHRHSELLLAHHFLYDLRLAAPSDKVDFVVMGINPGEPPWIWSKGLAPTEETSEHDYHAAMGYDRKSSKWYKDVNFFCGTTNVVQAECFFWSSRNVKQLEERFGPL